jgi:hypothetical protein
MLLVQTFPDIGGADLWEKYGLTGLILFALFMSLFGLAGAFLWFGRRVLSGNEAAVAKSQEFLDNVMDQHRQERVEWRADAHQQAEVYAAAVREMHERTVEACERNTEACNALATEIRTSTRRTVK